MWLPHYLTVAWLFTSTESMMYYEEAEYYYDQGVGSKRNYYSQAGRCPSLGLSVNSEKECASAAVLLKLVANKMEPAIGQTYGCYWDHATGYHI